ncbi:MAG: hypothetical protein LBN92_04515 [Treponema sp.]|jgi:methyl-accepting chemotaxis protein|nr:hypothetical protein [Treponema sp.]
MEIDKIEQFERHKKSLVVMASLFFGFFFAAIFGVFILTSVMQATTLIHYVCSRVGLPTLEQAMAIVEPAPFRKLAESLDESDPYYEETRLKLLGLKKRTGARYIYTMAPKDGSVFRYIIDGSAEKTASDFSALGDEEDIAEWDSAALAAYQSGNIQIGTLDQSEAWGATVSVYGPISDQGKTVGLIGIDLEAETITRWIRTQVFWQGAVVVAVTLLGLVLYVLLRMRVSKFSLFG